jgi:hypothetical protein
MFMSHPPTTLQVGGHYMRFSLSLLGGRIGVGIPDSPLHWGFLRDVLFVRT